MADLYFHENYGRLYEEMENGSCEIFEFSHSLGTIKHVFIKREIPAEVHGKTYYDIVTPYGYGGPLIVSCVPGGQRELTEKFAEAFREYCRQNDIVSEFIRFHPVLANADNFVDCYQVSYIRNTVGTKLREYDDPVQKEFSKSTRKNIRKALEADVEYRFTLNPQDITEFKAIYHRTMERNNADSYYYFDDAYFDKLLEYFGDTILMVEVLYEGQVIGIGLNYVYGDNIHTHLSGTLEEYHHLSPAYILQYALVVWGKENGYELIHDGGGRTNSLDDKLYMFKKQFGKNTTFKFYVGRKVWNSEVYDQLCEAAGAEKETEYFPAYRSVIKRESLKPVN